MEKLILSFIFLPAAIVVGTMYGLGDEFEKIQSLRSDLEATERAYLFTSMEECEKSKGKLEIPCDIAFDVAKKKSKLVNKQINGLVTCKRFFDPTCSMGEDGYPNPTMVGIFYIDSKVPNISPIYMRPSTSTLQLPSGCIIRKSDKYVSVDGIKQTLFKLTNFQDPYKEIKVSRGKHTDTYELHEYIDKNKNQKLDRRLKSCIR